MYEIGKDLTIVRETEKAYLLEMKRTRGSVWAPKAAFTNNVMAGWFRTQFKAEWDAIARYRRKTVKAYTRATGIGKAAREQAVLDAECIGAMHRDANAFTNHRATTEGELRRYEHKHV